MTTKNFEIDLGVANEILSWAQRQLDTIPDEEFGDDWWGCYQNNFDVNIWLDDKTRKICVTVYPLVETADGVETDTSRYNRIGYVDVALWNYDFEDCGHCGRQMNKKWGSTYPHRYDDIGVVCGECWNQLTYGGYE